MTRLLKRFTAVWKRWLARRAIERYDNLRRRADLAIDCGDRHTVRIVRDDALAMRHVETIAIADAAVASEDAGVAWAPPRLAPLASEGEVH